MNRKINESRSVANEFCKAYTRQFGVPASVIDVETENVDAIIDVGGNTVALELVSYRERDEYHEVEETDSHVKGRISEALAIAAIPPFAIHIEWAMEARTKLAAGLSVQRARLPFGPKAIGFADEIVALLFCVQKDRTLCDKRILFCNDPEDLKQNPTPGCVFLDRKSFQLLSHYCCEIRCRHAACASLQTSANFRVGGLDETQLTGVVRDKFGKLARYRDGIHGKQLWLAVHSDGRHLSTRPTPGLHKDAVQAIRQEIQRAEGSFDKVWWVENTGFVDVAELHEVQ